MRELKTQTSSFPWQAHTEGQLAIDVAETPEAIVIQSPVAGVDPENLDVFVQPEMVTIRGTRHRDAALQEAHSHVSECFWGHFSRTVLLPSPIDATRVQANMEHGVLTLTLPKTTHGMVKVAVQNRNT
jgi:HSP20 family protein